MKKIAIVLFCTSLALTNNNVQAINGKEVLQTAGRLTGRVIGGGIAPLVIGGYIAVQKMTYSNRSAIKKMYGENALNEEYREITIKQYLSSATYKQVEQEYYHLGASCAKISVLGWGVTKILGHTTTILSPKGQRFLQRVGRTGLITSLLLMAPIMAQKLPDYRMAQKK
jgi:hypothetical protein